jgi:hypothetical protein
MFPVTRLFLAIHDGDDPDAVGLVDVYHSIGKNSGEVAASRSIENAKQFRLSTNNLN